MHVTFKSLAAQKQLDGKSTDVRYSTMGSITLRIHTDTSYGKKEVWISTYNCGFLTREEKK